MKCPQHYLTACRKLSCFTMGSMFQQDKSLTQEVPSQPKLLLMLKWPSNKWLNTLRNGTMGHLQRTEVLKLLTGPYYTKDYPHKEEGKALEEAYYTQFGTPYQPGGQYRAAGPGFYQRNNGNSLYPARIDTIEESLSKFMVESAKRHEENSNIIKETQASTDAVIRNQGLKPWNFKLDR
ncbi:hypothetical protein Tco_0725441 [Tanacetum coccineum]|uniref:Uncharacterized protein n=1 Tax=Tanacetum coccineum TaxID=301880 RepID=A0ABQ4YDL2_9ASTR